MLALVWPLWSPLLLALEPAAMALTVRPAT
jgi:hypothetical protein